MVYKNGYINALIRTMLFCRKLYGARSNFDKIATNPNNVSKTQIPSHVRLFFEASVCPIIKRGGKCGTNV